MPSPLFLQAHTAFAATTTVIAIPLSTYPHSGPCTGPRLVGQVVAAGAGSTRPSPSLPQAHCDFKARQTSEHPD